MATCITPHWDPNGTTPRVQLTVTQTSSTESTVTMSWKLEYIASYAVSTSIEHDCKVVIDGSTVYNGSYAIGGKTGTRTISSGTKTVSKGANARNVSFSCSMDFSGITWSGKYAGSNKSASGTISVAAATKYTVKYDANGGSGAPGSQTKIHGTALTLSSTKPTRTGYSFLGWNTSKSATTASYSAGGSYTTNASTTLYAVWKANTYTVKYDANGGSGAPGSQTKTHGVTLTLSATKPTRDKYEFAGWGVAKSSTTATYAAGGSYTANASITLYAVWKVGYVKPRITSMTVDRCNSSEVVTDDGTQALVVFNWTTDKAVSSIKIEWKLSSSSTYPSANVVTISASGTSGAVRRRISEFVFATESTYDIRVTVTDSGGSTPSVRGISGSKFSFDAMPEDKGVALGKSAELEGVCDIAYQTRHLGGILQPILNDGTDFNSVKAPNVYTLKTTGTSPYLNCPFGRGTGTLEVRTAGDATDDARQVHQIATYCSKDAMTRWERFFYQSAWGNWYKTFDMSIPAYEDSGWMTPTLGPCFEVYNSLSDSAVKYRKINKTVEIRGVVHPSNAGDGIGVDTTKYEIFTLPAGFRPSSRIALRMQGSKVATWLLIIESATSTKAGEVSFSRYSIDGENYIGVDTGVWLPFQATFFVD